MFVLFFRQFIFKTFLLHIIIGCIKVGEMVSSSNYSPGFDTIFFCSKQGAIAYAIANTLNLGVLCKTGAN